MHPLRWFATLIRPYAGRLALAAVALVLSGAVSLVLPAVAGRVVDAALVEKSLARLQGVMAFLIGAFAVSAVLSYAETYLMQSTAARILQGLRARLHAHLLSLTPAFFESQRTGELLSRLNSDIGSIESALAKDLVNGLQQSLVLVGALAILLAVHLKLTGLMLLAVPPVVVVAVLFGLRFEKLSKMQQDAAAEATVAAEEALSGIRTVQAFVREPEERTRYSVRLAKMFALQIRATHTWGAFGAVVSFVGFSAFALVLWYGATLVIDGRLTAGQLTSFLLYTLTVAGAVGSLTTLWGGLRTASGATQRVREILATPPAIADPPDATRLARPRGTVAWRGVRFTYATAERPALDDISLEAEPGRVLALVGPSGGGKTTLVSLLLRFHDPQEGAVEIDGFDVRRVRLADVRGAIGFVPQDVFLFGGTIAENVRYGRPDADDGAVRAAAEAAQAHAFIERLPQGYATVVGERGVRLSAGERQRLAIARVFLKDPAILVLDEATSALDAESEHLVQRALERLFEGRTTIVIAHRLATVRRAHRVAVIDRGCVVQRGTHDELVSGEGLYRRLVELQMLGRA